MSAEKFIIPADPREADRLCGQLGELATAVGWKRSAITFARLRVQDEPGRPTAEMAKSGLLSPREFALLGIHGLRSTTTIRRYWQAWFDAISDGVAQPVALGDEVELPDAEFDEYYRPADPNPTVQPWANTPLEPAEPMRPHVVGGGVHREEPLHVTVIGGGVNIEKRSFGQGDCPPRASDVEQGEPDAGAAIRDRLPPRREPSQAVRNRTSLRVVRTFLEDMEHQAKVVHDSLKHIIDWGDQRGVALGRIKRTRKLLNDIERIVREDEA
jgi:hypothetical protein